MPLVPKTATRMRTYAGSSTTSYQDALDKAIASALRAAGGADRSISWTVKSVSGTAGGKGGRRPPLTSVRARSSPTPTALDTNDVAGGNAVTDLMTFVPARR
jgi:hypothetical protein